VFILIGEYKGDYDDFYERPVEAIACSQSEEKLRQYWETLENKQDYVDFRIEEVPIIE
jgi:hypothetical protein